MTALQMFKGLLIELSKVNAPSMLLDDFNYFINKAIYQYINKRYNLYDINQQLTDDLRVLKATTVLPASSVSPYGTYKSGDGDLFGGIYEVIAPLDYFHMLNCVCVYEVNSQSGCYNEGNYAKYAAKRLTADAWSSIVNDYYNRPLPQRPYYYIHHVNQQTDLPTNPLTNSSSYLDLSMTGTDPVINTTSTLTSASSNYPRTINLKNIKGYNQQLSTVERTAGVRYGNSSNVRIEIRYGPNDVFQLKEVMIDYLKTPQHIRITQEQTLKTQDTSQILEFPDYVCQEIINELVHLVMETTADPRLQTHAVISQSIASPVQAQTQPSARKAD